MSVEFISILGHREGSASRLPQGPAIGTTYLSAIAKAHEYAGFDRAPVLLPRVRAAVAQREKSAALPSGHSELAAA